MGASPQVGARGSKKNALRNFMHVQPDEYLKFEMETL
jgi:hypothetical protein